MKTHERRQRNLRVIEPLPFFFSEQTAEFGEADGYGLQQGHWVLSVKMIGETNLVSTHLLHYVHILNSECITINLHL
jgi:hypothetical protein